jgi:hypothetical protein
MDERRRRSEVTSKIGEETRKKKNARKLKTVITVLMNTGPWKLRT